MKVVDIHSVKRKDYMTKYEEQSISNKRKLKLMVAAIRITDEYDCVAEESEDYTEEMSEFLGCSGSDMYQRLICYIEINF